MKPPKGQLFGDCSVHGSLFQEKAEKNKNPGIGNYNILKSYDQIHEKNMTCAFGKNSRFTSIKTTPGPGSYGESTDLTLKIKTQKDKNTDEEDDDSNLNPKQEFYLRQKQQNLDNYKKMKSLSVSHIGPGSYSTPSIFDKKKKNDACMAFGKYSARTTTNTQPNSTRSRKQQQDDDEDMNSEERPAANVTFGKQQKKTYIDNVVEYKQFIPGPGFCNLNRLFEKRDAKTKTFKQERRFADQIPNFPPGPGTYNTQQTLETNTESESRRETSKFTSYSFGKSKRTQSNLLSPKNFDQSPSPCEYDIQEFCFSGVKIGSGQRPQVEYLSKDFPGVGNYQVHDAYQYTTCKDKINLKKTNKTQENDMTDNVKETTSNDMSTSRINGSQYQSKISNNNSSLGQFKRSAILTVNQFVAQTSELPIEKKIEMLAQELRMSKESIKKLIENEKLPICDIRQIDKPGPGAYNLAGDIKTEKNQNFLPGTRKYEYLDIFNTRLPFCKKETLNVSIPRSPGHEYQIESKQSTKGGFLAKDQKKPQPLIHLHPGVGDYHLIPPTKEQTKPKKTVKKVQQQRNTLISKNTQMDYDI